VLDANGDPTNYFRVTNPASLPAQMGKAFRSAAALAAVASTSVVGVGQRNLGNAAIYQANYDSLTWSSRLYAFKVDSAGNVSNTEQWEAASLIKPPTTRNKLFLGRGGSTTPFALTTGQFSSLAAAEQLDFGDSVTYEYLIGDKNREERKGGTLATLRNRGTTSGTEVGSVLGDIVNSDPQIINKKDYGYTASDATYAAFLTSLTSESLAVGSNNGFFHIFNASPQLVIVDPNAGQEIFGFMPQAARTNVKDLASSAYSHRYFVDGSIGLGHAKIAVPGDATVAWRSIVVGSGGAGAQTVFAINAPNDQSYSANNVLWEINANTTLPVDTGGISSAGRLGNVMGRPAIGKLSNGVWVVIFGNGYNSVAGTASLIVARLDTGAILAVIPTNNTVTANGLGSTEIVKKTTGNLDTIEYVYAADFKGNIWRFDIGSITAGNAGWPSSAKLLYKTITGRPITAEIKVGPATGDPSIVGGKMVYFGTGSYLNAADVTTSSPSQALYGIYDNITGPTNNTTPWVSEANLETMTINMPTPTSDVRTTSTVAGPWYTLAGKKGWVVPFSGTYVAAGERVIAPPVRFTVTGKVDAFLFTSIVPGVDECTSSLDAWITGIDAMTGSYAPVFNGLLPNSIKVTGGSPRGVFVLDDSSQPSLFISQTIFNGVETSTSYTSSSGARREVTINGITGITRLIRVDLTTPCLTCGGPSGSSPNRFGQSWRQLK
jgi:type IV pilus assembly protein PilY1